MPLFFSFHGIILAPALLSWVFLPEFTALKFCMVAGIPLFLIDILPLLLWRYMSIELKNKLLGYLMVEDFYIAKFIMSLGILYASGIDLAQAVEISGGHCDSKRMQNICSKMARCLRGGSSLEECFRRASVFPKTVLFMIGTAEPAGKLDETFQRIADYYWDGRPMG
jgi:type II secretory pathway component PulF